MILFVKDLQREINILNWYKGEAEKRRDGNAVVIQSDADAQDAMLYHIRCAVTDILRFVNSNRVRFTCKYEDDCLLFELSPLREGREYILDILKEAIRQYIVYEVRRLWMMLVRPEWADASLRENLRQNIKDAISAVTSGGNRVRRRATTMGI
ncbi:MAG: hypothetical protein E7090_03990 [Bacteroidales bacterium]|nr:hypothetical protein [Bacteroidales bacterium]